MIRFKVSHNAIHDLNTDGKTPILNKDGSETGAEIRIDEFGPEIYNLFGYQDHIYLDRLRLVGNLLNACFTTHDVDQHIGFELMYGNEGYRTEWTYNLG